MKTDVCSSYDLWDDDTISQGIDAMILPRTSLLLPPPFFPFSLLPCNVHNVFRLLTFGTGQRSEYDHFLGFFDRPNQSLYYNFVRLIH
jgi:hypothetical protein